MTAMVDAHRTAASARRASFAGLGPVLRLYVRRERLALVIWEVALAATVGSSFGAIAGLYPTAADRSVLATTISANPAFLALSGPVTSLSVGGVTAWRVGVLGGLAVSAMAAWTVIRRTRADEEAGRAELLASGVVGRHSMLGASLLLSWSAALVAGLLGALSGVATGQSVGGSIALGAALAGPGLVFAGMAAVAAQLFESARTVSATTFTSVGLAFAARAAGDLSPGGHWLSWLSPLGWAQKVDAFGANRWQVLVLFVLGAVILALGAAALSQRRDLGLGFFAARAGPARGDGLRSGLALAARLHRSTLISWTVGFAVLGVLTASLARSAVSLLADNPGIAQLMRDLGGAGALSDQLFSAMGRIAALLAAAYGIASTLRMRDEETSGRADVLLSTGLSRSRWMAGHLAFGLLGPALALVVAGLFAGTLFGAESGRLGAGLGTGLATMMVQIPAALTLVGVVVAILGVLPRWSSGGWLILGLSLILGQLGTLLGLPQFLMDLSPFTHVPALPGAPMVWTPMIWLLLVAGAGVSSGLLGFRRRDVG